MKPRACRCGAVAAFSLAFLGLSLGACSHARATMYRRAAFKPPRPLLVVDLDDTVVAAPNGTLGAILPGVCAPAPFPHAAEALRRLSASYQIVFLTARPALLARGTLGWLDAHAFPCAPVVFASSPRPGRCAQEQYKRAALAALVAAGWEVAWGVGDKPHDVVAYEAVGAHPILILGGPRDRDGRAAQRARAGEGRVVVGHATAWRTIEAILRPGP